LLRRRKPKYRDSLITYIRKKHMPSEVIELSGYIIDSWTLPRAWDVIMDRGGNFIVEEMRVGISKTEPSYARLKVEAPMIGR